MSQVKDKTIDWTEIIEDGNKPRSIREIKEKYQLSFPFSVRRLIPKQRPDSPAKVGDIYVIRGFVLCNEQSGPYWGTVDSVYPSSKRSWRANIDVPGYVLWD